MSDETTKTHGPNSEGLNVAPKVCQTTERRKALIDAAWAVHCWIVDKAVDGELAAIAPADLSVLLKRVIMACDGQSA